MTDKVRVYELANQLGLTSKQLLATLKAQGEFVKSASSTVEAPVARRMRKAAGIPESATPPDLPALPAWDILRPVPHAVPVPAQDAQLVTVREAWDIVDVSAATIRKWASRGYLQKVGHRGREALYDRADLERVSWRTHARTNTSPAWPQLHVPSHYYRRLITTAEAARLLDVSPSTVRSWVTRGHLEPCGRSRRSHLFTVGSVLTAGRRTTS